MDLLFWSGGKDSLLALRYYQLNHKRSPELLTTYNEETNRIPFQHIPMDTIINQSKILDLTLHQVPLPPEASNDEYLTRVEKVLKKRNPNRLVFGDWHLEDIRRWREQQFEPMGYSCLFPIWKKPFPELIAKLEEEEITVKISYVDKLSRVYISRDDLYDRSFVESLPEHIDPMGENGEFHTCVFFPESI